MFIYGCPGGKFGVMVVDCVLVIFAGDFLALIIIIENF